MEAGLNVFQEPCLFSRHTASFPVSAKFALAVPRAQDGSKAVLTTKNKVSAIWCYTGSCLSKQESDRAFPTADS